MISPDRLKALLIENPNRLILLLECFGFQNIKEKSHYISFGRDETSSPKSIVIYKDRNSSIIVRDYAKGVCGDLFYFLKVEKGISRKEVIVEIQRVLGLSSFSNEKSLESLGLNISNFEPEREEKEGDGEPEPIDESLLYEYKERRNERFLKDGIQLKTQKKYGLRYDEASAAIIIPIRRADGKLVGIKARFNREVGDKELKYVYFEPCQVTKTLFGYCFNLEELLKSDTVYIFEAEKSVMQADGFGVRNCVALGSSSISRYQCELLKKTNPKNIVLMTDKGLMEIVREKDCKTIHSILSDVNIYVWNPSEEVPDKSSPTDLGKEGFKRAIRKELVKWNPQ